MTNRIARYYRRNPTPLELAIGRTIACWADVEYAIEEAKEIARKMLEDFEREHGDPWKVSNE